MKKVVNINKYRSKKNIEQTFKNFIININEQTVDMYKKSVINYEQYKTLMNRLTELLNEKGDKNE